MLCSSQSKGPQKVIPPFALRGGNSFSNRVDCYSGKTKEQPRQHGLVLSPNGAGVGGGEMWVLFVPPFEHPKRVPTSSKRHAAEKGQAIRPETKALVETFDNFIGALLDHSCGRSLADGGARAPHFPVSWRAPTSSPCQIVGQT